MWWEYIVIAAVLLFGIYAFAKLTGFETRLLSRAISRSLSVTAVTLGSHELESPHPVAADPFCGFLDGVRVLEAE